MSIIEQNRTEDIPVIRKVLKNMLKDPKGLSGLTSLGVGSPKWYGTGSKGATPEQEKQRRQYKRIKFLTDKLVTNGLLARISSDNTNPKAPYLYTVENVEAVQKLVDEPSALSEALYIQFAGERSRQQGEGVSEAPEGEISEALPTPEAEFTQEEIDALSNDGDLVPAGRTDDEPSVSNAVLFKALMGMAERLEELAARLDEKQQQPQQPQPTPQTTTVLEIFTSLKVKQDDHQKQLNSIITALNDTQADVKKLLARETNCAFRAATATTAAETLLRGAKK